MKNCKARISTVLAIVLIISLLPISVFAKESTPKKKYLFMGDSMSFNFVNDRHNYTNEFGKRDHYPAIIADTLGYEGLNLLGRSPFTRGGVRTTDIYACLSDEFDGDGCTAINHTSINNEHDEALNLLSQADVITIQLGHSNVSFYGLTEIGTSIIGASEYGHDLGDIFTKKDLLRVKPLIQECIEKIAMHRVVMNAIAELIDKNSCKLYRKALVNILGEDFVGSIEKIMPMANGLVDTIMYVLISDMVHFDNMMKCVMDGKKDNAKIYVLGLFNPAPDIKVEYTIKNKTVTLKLKDVIKVFFDIMNKYYKCYSQYKKYYSYIPPAENAETYYSLMSKNKKVTKDLLVALMNDGELPASKKALKKLEKKVNPLVPGAMKIASEDTVNLNALIDSIDKVESIVEIFDNNEKQAEYLKKVLKLDKNNNFVNAQEMDRFAAKVILLTMLQGVAVHPTKSGHRTMANNILSYMQ